MERVKMRSQRIPFLLILALSLSFFFFWTQKSKIHFMRIHSGMRKQTPMKAKNENQNAKERLPSRLTIGWYILTDTYPDIIPLFIWIAGKLQSDTNTFILLQVCEIMTDTYPDTAILTHNRLFLKLFCIFTLTPISPICTWSSRRKVFFYQQKDKDLLTPNAKFEEEVAKLWSSRNLKIVVKFIHYTTCWSQRLMANSNNNRISWLILYSWL